MSGIDTNKGHCPACGSFLIGAVVRRGDGSVDVIGYATVEDYRADHPFPRMPVTIERGIRIPWRVCSLCGNSVEKMGDAA
jgi:hypothetical protein